MFSPLWFYNSHNKELEERNVEESILLHHKNLLTFLLTYKGSVNLKKT